jgi:bifunctional DNA primase/polymerase-like protein
MHALIYAGLDYLRLGFSVVPASLDKRPIVSWRRYQTTRMPEAELQRILCWPAAQGIAIICGKISGELEVLDIDSKNDPGGDLFQRFEQAIRRHLPHCWTRLVVARTKNAGYHVYYRCPLAGRNAIIARRLATATEKLIQPELRTLVLIEIRANGGYVMVDPTPGYCFIQGSPGDVPLLQDSERDALLFIAASFNAYHPVVYAQKNSMAPVTRVGSPLDDYDRRGNVIDLLVRHGWMVVRTNSVRTFLRRPGKTDHDHSGDFNHQLNRFGVFSPNTRFEVGKGYRPSAVYAILECGGDFRLAAKQLSQAGFGIPYKDQAA